MAGILFRLRTGCQWKALPSVYGSRGPRRPKNLCLDKGYDYADVRVALRVRCITVHIRCRGEEHRKCKCKCKCKCKGGERARPLVVERTNSWQSRLRALLSRWKVKAANYQALVELASGIIAFQQAFNRL